MKRELIARDEYRAYYKEAKEAALEQIWAIRLKPEEVTPNLLCMFIAIMAYEIHYDEKYPSYNIVMQEIRQAVRAS
ncbi:hypothetical protein QBC45DRAFT_394606 [Copromyces sp. CBS 386.78]|nr:hypothetical protein QBC45DRAFT_394606 [Copromyces sp. CBS 386.78]